MTFDDSRRCSWSRRLGLQGCWRATNSWRLSRCLAGIIVGDVYIDEAEEEANQSRSAEAAPLPRQGTASERPHVGRQLLGKSNGRGPRWNWLLLDPGLRQSAGVAQSQPADQCSSQRGGAEMLGISSTDAEWN